MVAVVWCSTMKDARIVQPNVTLLENHTLRFVDTLSREVAFLAHGLMKPALETRTQRQHHVATSLYKRHARCTHAYVHAQS